MKYPSCKCEGSPSLSNVLNDTIKFLTFLLVKIKEFPHSINLTIPIELRVLRPN